MLRMDLNEILQGSESVVVGSVEEVASFWNEDRTRIYTRASIRIRETLKNGVSDEVIQVVVPGGKVGEITEIVTDTPSFSLGDESLLFLRKSSAGTMVNDVPLMGAGDAELFEIHGGVQGKRNIVDGKVGSIPLDTIRDGIRKNRIELAPSESSSMMLVPQAASGVTISGISPASASAGTGSRITISGSGFGASVGTPFFFYQGSMMFGSSSWVNSWSDTKIEVTVPIFLADGYPAAAGSGPVNIRTSGGQESNDYPFIISFAYGQIKWPDSVVPFRVNPGGNNDFLQAVRNAAGTWNGVSGKDFELTYEGTTSATDYQTNSVNEIVWGTIDSSTTIGQASIKYSNNTIVECDIKFNTRFQWSSSATTPSGSMDVETIALHELGHWLNLRDLYGNLPGYASDAEKVMYGYASYGQQKRNLHADDIAGIRYIYPSSAVIPDLSVSPASRSVDRDSGSTSFEVSNTGSGTLNWTASVLSGNSWLWITSGSSGTNSGTIQCSFLSNTEKSSRSATIRVSAAGSTGSPTDVTVIQSGEILQIGVNPGLIQTVVPASQLIDIQVNTSNVYGDTPIYEWFPFTALQSGNSWPLYLLTDYGIVDMSKAPPILPVFTFSFGPEEVMAIARLTLSDLGLSAGDTFLYGYAYMNASGAFILDNLVIITAQ